MTGHHPPPMDPDTSEATVRQRELARQQGDAYGRALQHMTQEVAEDGAESLAGEYRVGYAVEDAEGMYEWTPDGLVWRDPAGENLHLEIAVRDGADGRFVPGLRVSATLIAPDGTDVGTHEQPMLWHPMLYHYGRNWRVPGDGEYTLRVHIDPPTFMRHDEVNGMRFADPVDVEFTGVRVETER
jgi:Fe2+ transport protein